MSAADVTQRNATDAPDVSARTPDAPPSRVELAREPSRRLGSILIEPRLRRLAHRNGREASLEPRVMQVLVALARSPGQILTRDDLVEACWSGVIVGEDAITRVIGKLRRLSEGIAADAFEIETITKVGYRLVETRQDGRSGADAGEAAAPRAPAADGSSGVEPPLAAAQEPAANPSPHSICVLPFNNMSADPEQDYFSDGISEDIMTDLSNVSALSVVARNTAFSFKGATADIRRTGRDLNVAYVLEGSVRKVANRVRITAQLSNVASGAHVWAERWDRDLTDIFAIQDEISRAVVTALKLRLLPDEQQAIERRGTASPEAYNLYLQARKLRDSGNDGDPRRDESIIRLADRAAKIDPHYAHAWALLAVSQCNLHFVHRSGGDDGLAAADRALSLDPHLAEAHAVKAVHLASQGQDQEAVAELEIALHLDPLSWEANKQAGYVHFRQGDFKHAIAYYSESTRLSETDFVSPMMLFTCHGSIGDRSAAQTAAGLAQSRAEKALEHDHSNGAAMAVGCLSRAFLGDGDGAREWARRALLIDPNNGVMRYNIASALAAHLQDVDSAVDLLAPLVRSASALQLSHMRVDPDLDAVRLHPRFIALVAAREARLTTHGAAGTGAGAALPGRREAPAGP
ncbi:MAG TPA: winged helix-turn-helix domain-containing protein [Caulobacteraceae bacterium]|jgi:adenylate cyclase|nr:winged helix-turn-helix domain-containing protein [Caulobacteraceae bacterium]